MKPNDKVNEIFNVLKNHILSKSKYSPEVKRSVVDNKYPLVVFEKRSSPYESLSQDEHRLDKVVNFSFEVSIFATDIKNTNSEIICDELEELVNDVMSDYYLMQGGLDAKLKNINTSKATKYVLHYACKYCVRQDRIN